ncbi:MAG: fibronectin type III domain-containing protein [Bacteroidia bacterium]|nr:fibronectin type III domain-containing protein [Bacteroidia bacterium]
MVSASPGIPTISVASPPYCTGQNYTLGVLNPVVGETYSWVIGGNVSSPAGGTGTSLVVSWANAGNAVVTLTATNTAGCSASSTTNLLINSTPVAPTIITNVPICSGSNLILTGPAGKTSYLWSGPNGWSATSTSATITRLNANNTYTGLYALQYVEPVSGCTSLVGQTSVNVITLPTTFNLGSNSPVCAGNTLLLTATAISSASYTWVGPDNTTYNSQNLIINNAQVSQHSGVFVLTAIVPGCTTYVQSINVLISNQPSPPAPTSNSPVCVNGTLNLTVAATPNATYTWSGPAGFSSTLQNPSRFNMNSSTVGVYNVTVATPGCAPASGQVAVTVYDPVITTNSPVCSGNVLSFTATNYTGATYSWQGPSGQSQSSASFSIPSVTTAASGIWVLNFSAPGCVLALSTPVVVSPALSTPIISVNSNPVCVGSTLTLSTNTVLGATYTWSGPAGFTGNSAVPPPINNVTSLNAGTYSITVSLPGCNPVSNSINVVVNDLAQPIIQANSTTICEGQNINLAVLNPVSGATYTWQGPDGFAQVGTSATVNNVTTLKAGVYSVTASLPGCANKTSTITISVNKPPVAPNPTNNGPLCAGQQLQLNATPSPGASYSWAGPGSPSFSGGGTIINPTVANITTSNAGVYTITVTVPGCVPVTGTTTVVVNTPPNPPSFVTNSPTCVGQTLSLGITNPSNNATYTWSGPNGFTSTVQNPTLTNITTAAAGIYSVTISVPPCSAITGTVGPIVVNIPPPTPIVNNVLPICTGGVLTLSVSNVASGVAYNWSGPGLSQSASTVTTQAPTAPGTYTYSVTASVSGCSPATTTTNVVVNAPITSIAVSPAQVVCTGSNLNLTASPTPLLNNVSYQWSGPAGYSSTQQNPTIANVNTLRSGVYTLVASTPGCSTISATVNVTVNTPPGAITLQSNSPVCIGKNLQLTATNVSGAQSYQWSGPNGFSSTTTAPTLSLNNVNSANAGIYSVVVTVEGCSATATATTTVVVQDPSAVTIVSNSPVCAGSTLDLQAVANGGITDATYQWTAPNGFVFTGRKVTIPNIAPFFAGTFTLTTTIPNCTSATQTTNVVINNSPANPSPSSNSPVCAGNDIILSAVATNGALYQWAGPNDYIAFGQNQTISGFSVTTASSGEYTVTVSLGSCSRTGTVRVIVNSPLPVDYVIRSNSPVCTGETLNFSVNNAPGASFIWKGPNGFSATTQNPSISTTTTANIGTYSLTVNIPGCPSVSLTHTPTIRLTPESPNPQSNSPICEGGTLRLTAVGTPGASYVWTGPNSFTSTLQNPVINNALAAQSGTYNVTVVTEGCAPKTGSVNVTINSVPQIEIGSNSPICVGGTLNLSATAVPGATYEWLGPNRIRFTQQNPTRTNVQTTDAGTYTLIVTVPGCDPIIRTTTVVINTPPPTPVINSNSPVCSGTTLRFSVSSISGATYSWSGPNGFTSAERNPTINNVTLDAEGEYSLIVSRAGCPSASANINVQVIPAPTNASASSNSPVCVGGVASFSAAPIENATYRWSGPNGFSSTEQNPIISGVRANQAGIYTLTVTVTGCAPVTRTTALVVNTLPSSITPSSNSPLCEGGVLQLSAPSINGASYSWSGPEGFSATQANVSQGNLTTANSGVYSVTVSVPGCGSVSGTVAVEVNQSLENAAVINNGPLCEGGVLNLNVNGVSPKTTYSWSGPSGFSSTESAPSIFGVSPANGGVYQVVLQTPGCGSITRSTNVIVNPGVNSLRINTNSPVCQGGTLRLSATPVAGAIYQWSGPRNFTATGIIATISNVTSENAGTYELTASIPACGIVRLNVEIAINPSLSQVNIRHNSPVCEGSSLQFSATGVEGASYVWSGPAGFSSTEVNPVIPSASTINSGVYSLTISSAGCGTRTLTTTVTVVPGASNFAITTNSPICAGQNLVLSVPQIQGATYTWSGPAGFSATGAAINIPQANTTNGGTYTVTANVPGCGTLSATAQVIVNASIASITASNNGPVCSGSSLALTASASVDATYLWRGPNGFTSTLASPVINNPTTANSGIYTVTVSTPQCGSRTATTQVVVNPSPAEIVALNNGPLCTNGVLVLNATFVPGASYFWSGPAGFTSTEASPIVQGVTSLNSGAYNVSVLLPGCGLVTRTTTVIVNPSLIDIVASNNGPVCTGTTLRLTVTSIPGATYRWSGPNGFSSTLQNPTIENIVPEAAGYYTVEVNSPACGNITVSTLVVIREGLGEVNVTNNGPLCEGQNLELNATLVAGAEYRWSGPRNFIATGASVSRIGVTLADSGVYRVTLIVQGCSSITYTTNVAIRRGANVQSVSQAQNAVLCQGEETSFEVTFAGNGPWLLTYSENGVGQIGMEVNVSPFRLVVRPNGVGERTYAFGCNGLTRRVTVRPAVTQTLIESLNAGCNGGGVLRVRGGGGSGSYTYNLSPGNVTNSTGEFTNLVPGNYTVVVRDAEGCSSTQTYTVRSLVPSAAPTVTSVNTSSVALSWAAVSGAASYTIQYRVLSSNAGFNAITGITTTSFTVTGLSSSTTYEFRLIVLCANGASSEPSESVVATTLRSQVPQGCSTPELLPVVIESSTTALLRWIPNQTGAVCYVIAYGPANQDPATWQQFLVTHPTSEVLLVGLTPGVRYGIRIRTNCTLCSTRNGQFTPFSLVQEFSMPNTKLGSQEAEKNPVVEIYPNPSQGIFAIRYEAENLLPAQIVIRNVAGQVIYEATIELPENGIGTQFIDLQGVLAGIYVVEFIQGQKRSQAKLLLQP